LDRSKFTEFYSVVLTVSLHSIAFLSHCNIAPARSTARYICCYRRQWECLMVYHIE